MNTSEIKRLSREKWHIQGFNSCLNYISHGPYSGLIGCHKNLGYGYTGMFFIFNQDYLEYYYSEKDLQNIGETFLKKYQRDKRYFRQVLKKDSKLRQYWMERINSAKSADLENLNKKGAIDFYQRIWRAYREIIGVGHAIEGISFVLEPLLKENLERALGFERHSAEFKDIFNVLFQPTNPSFASAEHTDLLKILRMIDKNKKAVDSLKKDNPEIFLKKLDRKIKEKILAHAQKYFYNQINYFYGEALKPVDYVMELRQMTGEDINARLKEEKIKYQRNNRIRKETIEKYRIKKDTVGLLKLSLEILNWQDLRKKVMLSCVYWMNLGLKIVAKQFEIPLGLLKRYSPEEITFDNLKRFDRKEAIKRMAHCVAIFTRKNNKMLTEIYSGKECERFMKIYQKKLAEKKDLHGTTACVGKVLGTIKVCRTKKDLQNFKKGQILVTAMTRPEFVPAMRRALAIVTDEGGLTCHAAIVSRELGIPCVIGTKIATEVLKEGDLVEVNANHGVVTVIKGKI